MAFGIPATLGITTPPMNPHEMEVIISLVASNMKRGELFTHCYGDGEYGGAIAFTKDGDTLYVCIGHHMYKIAKDDEQKIIAIGLGVHEALHQCLTPMDRLNKFIEAEAIRRDIPIGTLHPIVNIGCDGFIEHQAPRFVAGVGLAGLKLGNYYLDLQAEDISKAQTPYQQCLTAYNQFEIGGRVHGNFTFPEAAEAFKNLVPIYMQILDATNDGKRIRLFNETFDVFQPLIDIDKELARQIAEAMKNQKGNDHQESDYDGTGQNAKGKPMVDDDDAKSARQSAFSEMIEDAMRDLENEEKESDGSDSADASKDSKDAESDGNGAGSDSEESEGEDETKGGSSSESSEDADGENVEGGEGNEAEGNEAEGNSSSKSKKSSGERGINGGSSESEEYTDADGSSDESGADTFDGDDSGDGDNANGSSDSKSSSDSSDSMDGKGESAKDAPKSNAGGGKGIAGDDDTESHETQMVERTENTPQSSMEELNEALKEIEDAINGDDSLKDIVTDGILSSLRGLEEQAKRKLERIKAQTTRSAIEIPKLNREDLIPIHDIVVNSSSDDMRSYGIKVNQMRPAIDTLSRELQTLIKSDRGGKVYADHGRVCAKRLASSKLRTSVFEHRKEPVGIGDTEVFILMDASGSTSGWIYGAIRDTAIGIVEACNKVNIPVAVMGFTTDCGNAMHLHYCGFKSTLADRATLMRHKALNCNSDSLALYTARETMLHRQAKHKIILVLSDGLPSDNMARYDTYETYIRPEVEYAREVETTKKSNILFGGVAFVEHEDDEDHIESIHQFYGDSFDIVFRRTSGLEATGRLLKDIVKRQMKSKAS